MAQRPRGGKPNVSFTISQECLDIVDAYKDARRIDSRSLALREMVRFALGENPHGVSIMENLPPGIERKLNLTENAQTALKLT